MPVMDMVAGEMIKSNMINDFKRSVSISGRLKRHVKDARSEPEYLADSDNDRATIFD